jgi:hypothetical protein
MGPCVSAGAELTRPASSGGSDVRRSIHVSRWNGTSCAAKQERSRQQPTRSRPQRRQQASTIPTLLEGPLKRSLERTKLCGQAKTKLTVASRGLAKAQAAGCYLPCHEFERRAVDAIAQAGRFGAVLEDVALVAFAAGAVDFGTGKNEFEVGGCLDDSGIDRLPEAGPAGAAVELML